MFSQKSISHEEFLKRKRKKKLWKFGVTIFLIIFLIGLSSYLSHKQEIRISKVELNGGILVTQVEIESKTLTYLYGSYFWLFPKGNIFLYPKDKLEEYLRGVFKRIDTIDIHRKGFQILIIDITERKPFAIWCDKLPDLMMSVEEENCYFIDQNSTVFAKAPHFSGDAYFKYYGLISLAPGESPIGKEYIASTTKFGEISNLVSKTKKLLIFPLYLLAKGDDEFSIILRGGGEIYFDARESLSIAEQNLEALLQTPVFASSTGDLPIEYIDLRYGNKLFYKLKQ